MTDNQARVGAVVAFIVLLVVFISGIRHGMGKPSFFSILTSEEATQVYTVKELSPATETNVTHWLGHLAMVPKWEWVTPVNAGPFIVVNGISQPVPDDDCGVEFGGSVVVKDVRGGNRLVLEYEAPPTSTFRTACPTGIQFVVDEKSFATMSARYWTTFNAIQAEKALVLRLLAKNYYSAPLDAGSWRWVNVANVDPVIKTVDVKLGHGSKTFTYGDRCGIGYSDYGGAAVAGGIVKVRGEEGGKVLYEYTPRINYSGAPCPAGTLFFEDKKL